MGYDAIIANVMAEKHILKKFIRERSSRQGVRGFSQIRCSQPKCDWSWNTHKAHAVIDLKRQKVLRNKFLKKSKDESLNFLSILRHLWFEFIPLCSISPKPKRMIYNQKCKKCDHENKPSFDDSVFRSMVEKAIEMEKKFRNKKTSFKRPGFSGDDDGFGGPPHESSLCEKCGYGSSPCWKRR